jgi:diguanylate cyclase (GGDEF)-like protein
MAGSEDLVSFVEEGEIPNSQPLAESSKWRVVIADDDRDVHEATVFALQGVVIHGRSLEFLHVYSAEQLLELLKVERDVAVILLDVVMESEDAGLRAVERIRGELNLANVRIILRTGQPGYAPEMDVVARYDINDYKAKSELTRIKLFTAIASSVRAYEQLERMDANRFGLEKIIEACTQFVGMDGLGSFAEGVVLQITSLLGIKSRGLVCVARTQLDGQQPEFRVIAGAGPFAGLMGRSVTEIADSRVRERLNTCLQRRRTLIDDQSLTLFCPGNENKDFAAFVECTPAIRAVDRRLIEVFCTNIGLYGDHVRLIESLSAYAFSDALTGLPNRNAFVDQVEKEQGGGEQAVAVLNLDEFAETNELLGHQYGDEVLKRIADHLRQRLQGRATVARLGGDQFALFGHRFIINPDYLRGLFQPRFEVEGVDFPISFSLGLVSCDEFPSATGVDLLRFAGIALKRAKLHGHGQSSYYTTEVSSKTLQATRLLHNLRQALDQGQFTLVYEPHIELASGRVAGVEALIRWQRPGGGDVERDQFIPVAEHSGLIVEMGAWVLRKALEASRQIQAAGFRGVRMAVNVSAVEFRQPGFISSIDRALADAGVSPSMLELEITESVTLLEMEYVCEQLRLLRERGISVAIDDFGKGYSSLSYLDRLPADKLKIDRSFVHALERGQSGGHIAEMIINLSRAMNLTVLAEGVENAGQARRLADLGCDEVQGFYYGKSMTLEGLVAWMKDRSGRD